MPPPTLPGQGRRTDPGGPGLHLAGQAAGRLVSAHRADPGKPDVAAVRTEPERSGGEPAAQAAMARLEPRECDLAPGPLARLRRRPVAQGGREVGQPTGVGLLRVPRPPWRLLVFRLVPRAAQAVRRPRHQRGELVLADAVGPLGGPLLQVRPDQGEPEVVGERLTTDAGPRLTSGGATVEIIGAVPGPWQPRRAPGSTPRRSLSVSGPRCLARGGRRS